jgi:hypothetical protein
MAVTFLHNVFEQQSINTGGDLAVLEGDNTALAHHAVCTDEACLHERDVFYGEIISALNECVAENCCQNAAKSLVEDEPLAHREWKRLLDRVLSGSIKA